VAKLQRERAEKVAIAALCAQLVLGLVAVGVARLAAPDTSGLWASAIPAVAWFLLIGAGFWLMTAVHLRQLRLSEMEEEEWQRLVAERQAGGARGRLFEDDEIAAHEARSRLLTLEKYVLPSAGLVLALALAFAAYFLWPAGALVVNRVDCAQAAALMLICAMGTFLLGMYASGMARQPEWRPLKAGAGYMMACSILSGLSALALALGHFDTFGLLGVMRWVTPILMAVVAVEVGLNFVLDFYRPRIEGVASRPCYESRLLGMLTEPGGLFRTVSATLDYQFGFKVSETWFYHFLERAILPLVLFGVGAYWLLTCVVILGPQEEGIIECFGKPTQCAAECDNGRQAASKEKGNVVRGPGIYVKWPWPISRLYRTDAKRIRRFDFGYESTEAEKAKMGDQSVRRYLWSAKHRDKEFYVMVSAGALSDDVKVEREKDSKVKDVVPVGLIASVGSVLYTIDDYEKFLYTTADPEKLLETAAYREHQRLFAGVKFFEVMGHGRQSAGETLRKRIQDVADSLDLGVRVLSVCLEGIHPPVEEELGQAFEEVVAAEQEKQATIYKGETYANELKAGAEHQAASALAKAHGQRVQTRERARGEAARYEGRLAAYEKAPAVYRMSAFLDSLEKVMEKGKVRKYFLAPGDTDLEVLQFDITDKLTFSPAGIDLKEN